jgi:extradiol dioxygenase family protein
MVGLRHFTVVLRDEDEVDALRERARAAGTDVEDTADGPLLRDPAGNVLLFRTA